ncbi:MAG: hypothetical protein JO345_04580 [Streptosporangiaceae bacterium]|nr:hypothetical protein [Streptosporangiaceae bacterium]
MSSPVSAEVDDTTRNVLSSLSAGDIDVLAEGLEYREQWRQMSGLDERSYALVNSGILRDG